MTMNALNKNLKRYLPLLVFCAALLLVEEVAHACPNCKAGMSTDDVHAKSMAAGYYYSILFMLSMPFLIVTSFSSWMFFAVRKARIEREAKSAEAESLQDSADIISSDSANADSFAGKASI
jgi:hypothetical protein